MNWLIVILILSCSLISTIRAILHIARIERAGNEDKKHIQKEREKEKIKNYIIEKRSNT